MVIKCTKFSIKSKGGNFKSARSCSFFGGGSSLSEAGECCYCVPIFFLPCLFNQKRIRKWGRERENFFSRLIWENNAKDARARNRGFYNPTDSQKTKNVCVVRVWNIPAAIFETGLAICRADYTHRPIPYSASQEQNHKELLWWVGFMRCNICRYKF